MNYFCILQQPTGDWEDLLSHIKDAEKAHSVKK